MKSTEGILHDNEREAQTSPEPVRIVDADDELATAMNESFRKCREIDPSITLMEFINLLAGDGTVFEECAKLKAEKDARHERIRAKVERELIKRYPQMKEGATQ